MGPFLRAAISRALSLSAVSLERLRLMFARDPPDPTPYPWSTLDTVACGVGIAVNHGIRAAFLRFYACTSRHGSASAIWWLSMEVLLQLRTGSARRPLRRSRCASLLRTGSTPTSCASARVTQQTRDRYKSLTQDHTETVPSPTRLLVVRLRL